MDSPKVSIIAPFYETTDRWTEAIASVFAQKYNKYELLLVGNAKFMQLPEVVKVVKDPRVRQILLDEDHDLSKAVNVGIQASNGEFVTYLEAGNLYHEDRLFTHVTFLEQHPMVSLTYDGHYKMDSAGAILSMWRPAQEIKISELIPGLLPSLPDVMLRKKWATQFDAMLSKIVTLGCQIPIVLFQFIRDSHEFASVDRALVFRRCSSRSNNRNCLKRQLETSVRALDDVFMDHRFVKGGMVFREQVLARVYLGFSFQAFVKNETQQGREAIRQSIYLDRSILDMQAQKYQDFLIQNSVYEHDDLESLLRRLYRQLPPELAWLTQFCPDTVARGYLYRGAHSIMWGRTEQGRNSLLKAKEMGAQLDKSLLFYLLEKLSDYETELGAEATETVLKEWTFHLKIIGTNADLRWLRTTYMLNRAFKAYKRGQYNTVPRSVLQAAWSRPTCIANRGVLAIFIRSLINVIREKNLRML